MCPQYSRSFCSHSYYHYKRVTFEQNNKIGCLPFIGSFIAHCIDTPNVFIPTSFVYTGDLSNAIVQFLCLNYVFMKITVFEVYKIYAYVQAFCTQIIIILEFHSTSVDIEPVIIQSKTRKKYKFEFCSNLKVLNNVP